MPGSAGLIDMAGASAARAVADARAEQRDLNAQLLRSYRRERNFQAAALSEPLTAATLAPLADQGWRILHDRRWPGSTRGNVDHVVIGPGGVAVLDTKHWSQSVQVRDGRLWRGDDDAHDDVDKILGLTEAVQDLLLEIAGSDPGLDVGLSPIHVQPVLVFTRHERANALAPQVGRVWLSTLDHLPARLARRRCLTADQVALVGEYLAREMPPHLVETDIPEQRVLGVPARPRPVPPVSPEPPEEPLFDTAELAEVIIEAAALPLRAWTAFLHPAQARQVKRSFAGPARVRGPAGTGKTAVLLHRAAWLAGTRTGRVLVTSFVRTLPTHLAPTYQGLSPDTADRVDFLGIFALARRVLAENGQHHPVDFTRTTRLHQRAWEEKGRGTALERMAPDHYWREEIDHVIKGRGLRELTEYEAVDRRGRGLPLNAAAKHAVWELLNAYQDELDRAGLYDSNDVLSAALNLVAQQPPDPGWSSVLVDEVQDLSLLGLRLCRALAGDGPDALFLVGDGQQALYPSGFTLADAGISVTGRAVVFRTNYRNTRQVHEAAQALVADRDFTDLDTTTEPGRQAVEVLRDGPSVEQDSAPYARQLALLLRQAMRRHAHAGVPRGEMAVLCHANWQVRVLTEHLSAIDVPLVELGQWDGHADDRVKIGTIHRAKGLDFSAVYVVDLDKPAADGADPESAWKRDRTQREYVAYTRARDRLWVGRLRRPAV